MANETTQMLAPAYQRVLDAQGWAWPAMFEPPAGFVMGVFDGSSLVLSGMMAFGDSGPRYQGKVGREVTVSYAQEAAREAALQALAVAKHLLGSLDAIDRIIRMTVYVNAVDTFEESYLVANSASDVLKALLGERGLHARTSVVVAGLSYQTPVEIDVTLRHFLKE